MLHTYCMLYRILLVMIDKKVKQKKRGQIQKLIQERLKICQDGKTEAEVKREVMKEQRALSKQKKRQSEEEIRQKVIKDLEGKEEKVIDKAVKRAISKFHSQNKKANNPRTQLKKKDRGEYSAKKFRVVKICFEQKMAKNIEIWSYLRNFIISALSA